MGEIGRRRTIPNLTSGEEANLKVLVSRSATTAGALDLALWVREHLLSAVAGALDLVLRGSGGARIGSKPRAKN
jgi:hypothetical protein